MKLLRTGGQVLTARAAQVVAGAAIAPLLARALGPVAQGHYALTIAIATLAGTLLNGGVGLAAVPALRRGELPLARLLRAQWAWIAAAAAVLALAAWGLERSPAAAWAAAQLGWNGAVAGAAAVGAAALLAGDVLFYDVLARGRPVAGTIAAGARTAALLLLLLGWMAAGSLQLGAAVSAFAAAQVAGVAVLLRLLRREAAAEAAAPAALPGWPSGALPLAGRLARLGWLGQLSAVASLLHLRLNLALVTAWHGPRAVGIFTVAVTVGELLWLLPSALSPVLVYSSAEAGDDAARDRLAARALRWSLLATAAAALPLALLAGWLMPLVFGHDYAASAGALRALLPGIVAFAAGAVLAGDFIGRGRAAWNAQASALTLALNLAAGLLLIPRFGILGAAWASTIAYVGGAAWMTRRFQRATGLSWRALLATSDRRRGIPN